MACFLTFLMLVAIVVVLAMASVGSVPGARSRRIQQACRRLAAQRGAVFLPGGWFRLHRLTLPYGESRVLLQLGAARARPFAQIRINWPDPIFRCEIASASVGQAMAESFGMPEIPVGSASFDRNFRVSGDEADQVRRFLSEGVRWQIDQLFRFLDGRSFRVGILHGFLTVWTAASLDRFEDLERFTNLSLELYDQAMLTHAEGIEFVGHDTAQPVTEAVCPVCGEQIGDNMVVCRRCKSPHHDDCWKYFGGCSTYGCGETVSYRPGAPRDRR